MYYPKIIWDENNDSSWSSYCLFAQNAYALKLTETNFEQTEQGADGKYDLWTCKYDNLPAKKRWDLALECYIAQYNAILNIWTKLHDDEYTSGVPRVNMFFKWIPDTEKSNQIYNCQFIGNWTWKLITNIINVPDERREIKLKIWEI